MSAVTIDDFFPPELVTLEDFYPDGIPKFEPLPRRYEIADMAKRLSPESATVLMGLTKKLIPAQETVVEFLTIMQFCERVLNIEGVEIHARAGKPDADGARD